MNTEDNRFIDEMVGNALEDNVPVDVDRRLRAQLEEFRARLLCQPQCLSSPPRTHAARSRFRWLWAAAVAASLLVAAVSWVNLPNVNLTSVAYAEFMAVVENSEQPEWVHFVEGDRENWMSFQANGYYTKSRDLIIGADYGKNRSYWYDVAKNTLTISCAGPESNRFGSYAEFILEKIKHLEQSGLEVHKGVETLDGKTITVYSVTGFKEGKKDTLRYLFDPQTNRILGVEGVARGGLLKKRILMEYLKEGPADIYAIGVPRNAKVIDETPGPDVMALYEKVKSAFVAERQSRYEVSVEMPESFSKGFEPGPAIQVEVLYRRGQEGDSRRERYMIRWPHGLSHENALLHLEKLRKDFPVDRQDQVEAWLSKHKPEAIVICDGRRGTMTGVCKKQGNLDVQTITAPSAVRGTPPIRLDGKPVLIHKQGKWGELVGIENHPTNLQRVRSYFNPDRGYLREKDEFRVFGMSDSGVINPDSGHTDSDEVLEYAKTPGGRWYAHKTRKVLCSERETHLAVCFQDDRADFDPKLFDAGKITVQDLNELGKAAPGSGY
jgi:hypothetical protein